MRAQPLKVTDSRGHTLTTEAVERPYEEKVELPPRSIGEHRCELLSVLDALAAILVFDVFADDRVAHARAPCTQRPDLVLRVLPLTSRRNPALNDYPST